MRRAGGADVILVVMGGSALADDLAMLNPGGRPIGQLMAERARVIGSTLRSRPVENKASILELAPPSGDHRRGRRRKA